MLVSKILETTLIAGQTSVSFTDSDIPNSLIRVFSSDESMIPESRILTGNTLTVTYEAQISNKGVALEIVKQGLEIVDNVTSSDTDKALSAKQGKVLKDAVDVVDAALEALVIPDSLNDLNDVDITDITDGQVLAWDEDAEKFVNVDQSGGAAIIDYKTTEQETGQHWIDNKMIYQLTVDLEADTNINYNGWTAINTVITTTWDKIIKAFATSNSGVFTTIWAAGDEGYLELRTAGNVSRSIRYITLLYTKTI